MIPGGKIEIIKYQALFSPGMMTQSHHYMQRESTRTTWCMSCHEPTTPPGVCMRARVILIFEISRHSRRHGHACECSHWGAINVSSSGQVCRTSVRSITPMGAITPIGVRQPKQILVVRSFRTHPPPPGAITPAHIPLSCEHSGTRIFFRRSWCASP